MTEPAGEAPVAPPESLRRLPSWLLGRLAGPANRLVTVHLTRAGLQKVDYALLSSLAEFGPLSQADICRCLSVDPSDVVAALDRLADDGLAVRARDPRDRRRNLITLTPAGREMLAALGRGVDAAQDELVAPLDEGERAVLVALLRQLVDHHHHHSGAGGAGQSSR